MIAVDDCYSETSDRLIRFYMRHAMFKITCMLLKRLRKSRTAHMIPQKWETCGSCRDSSSRKDMQ